MSPVFFFFCVVEEKVLTRQNLVSFLKLKKYPPLDFSPFFVFTHEIGIRQTTIKIPLFFVVVVKFTFFEKRLFFDLHQNTNNWY